MTSTLWGIMFIQYVNGNTQMMSGMDERRWRPDASQLGNIYWSTQDMFKYKIIVVYFSVHSSTHQFPFLHALHHHEQDLLRLAFAIIESLLNSHQKLLSDVIVDQAGKRRFKDDSSAFFFVLPEPNAAKEKSSKKISPSVLWELVCERNDVGSSAAAVAHHHGDRRLVSQTLQSDGDHVGTTFDYQTH